MAITNKPIIAAIPYAFYECGICGCYHPVEFDGDCREDSQRFAAGELDDLYGDTGWNEVEHNTVPHNREWARREDSMNHLEYNGWYNYETWAVHLWLTNEEGSYNYWRQHAKEMFEQAVAQREKHWTVSEQARFSLADSLKDELENGSQDVLEAAKASASLWADLLGAALSEVNWNEVANAFLEDVEGYEREAA